MILLYLGIRLRQAFRVLRDAGWINVVLVTPFVLIFLFRLLENSQEGHWPQAGMAFVVALGLLHFRRRDHDFLSRLDWPPFFLRLLDYCLIALPLLLLLLALNCHRDALLLLLAFPLLALIRPPEKRRIYGLFLQVSFLPLQAFEWRGAMRRYGWLILLVYLAGLFTCRFTSSGLGITLLMALIVVAFYDDLEEKALLEIYLPANQFLKRKAYWQGLCFHLLLLPHYLLFLVFHSRYWYLLLTAVLVAESLLLFSLFYKYTHWRPQRAKAHHQVALGLYTAGLLIPFLAPASLFYCWVYYRKARQNLNYYYGGNQ